MKHAKHSVYISLQEGIGWIAHGRLGKPDDSHNVEDWDSALSELLNALQAGHVVAYGLLHGQGDLTEIPRLFWANAEIEPLGDYAWRRGQWYPFPEHPWQQIRLERSRVLAVWPRASDPLDHDSASEKPASRIRVDRGALDEWYREYVSEHERAGTIPSSHDDHQTAKRLFRDRVTRDRIRELRRKLAPESWKRGGRRPAKRKSGGN